jgi:glutamate-5-semialdehyde dehydrogenase (EC 1.2.1.41)
MSQQLAKEISQRAAKAARAVATLSEADKNSVLQKMADAIRARQEKIIEVIKKTWLPGKRKV